jgi:hypothetical protein
MTETASSSMGAKKWMKREYRFGVACSKIFDFYLHTPQTIYKLLLITCSANTYDFPYELLLITYPMSLVFNLERVCFIFILLAICYPSVWFFHLRYLRPRPRGRHRTTRH